MKVKLDMGLLSRYSQEGVLTILEKGTESGSQVSYCPECGSKVEPGTKFCPKCGAALAAPIQPSEAIRVERRPPKPPEVLGFVSAGVVLVLLASTYLLYPVEPLVISGYFQRMADQKIFIKPPAILLEASIFFFNAAGVWGIILSVLRIIVERSPRKALGDLFGGLFSFFVAFLLSSYATDVFTARAALAYFVVGIGLLVVANAIIYFALREKR